MLIALRLWGLKSRWEFLKTTYSTKRFNELTEAGKDMDLKKFRQFTRRYSVIAGVIGAGLLWAYGVSGHIGFVLWGVTALIVGSYACISFFTTTEKDLQWTERTESQLHVARYLVMASPIIVGVGSFLLPRTSQLFDEYAILNLFGLLVLGISVAAIPFAIIKIGKLILSNK